MMNCTLCSRGDLAVIEGIIRDNTSLRVIASMFGLSKDAVHRHKMRHMGISNGAAGHAVSTAADDRNGDKRDYWALVACFSPGVPQRVGQWPLTETVRVWPHEKRIRILQEAIRRGDLVLDRRGSEDAADWHIERPIETRLT